MNPQLEQIYFAAMLLQCPHRTIFSLQDGQLNVTVPAVFVTTFLHEMHVSSLFIGITCFRTSTLFIKVVG